MTSVNDTNIAISLGGSPATSRLQATSLTMGWLGQLAVGRGGTGLSTIAQGDLIYGDWFCITKLGHLLNIHGLKLLEIHIPSNQCSRENNRQARIIIYEKE